MATIYDWSTTAGNNATADANINWSEGMFPSVVNDSARQMMARQAEWLKDNGLLPSLGVNTITVTTNAQITAPIDGMSLVFKSSATNTAAVTISLNGGSGAPIKKVKFGGTEAVDLDRSDIMKDGSYILRYDAGANAGAGAWILINPTFNRSSSKIPTGDLRNLFINPLFSINQRGVSGTVVLAAGQYGQDRIKAGASGCSYNFSANNGVTTLNILSGSLVQVIEASNFSGRAGTYVLSWVGSAQGRIASGSYGSSGNVSASCDGSSNISVEFNVGTLSLVQFERDYVTDFCTRHPNQEMGICQRYFWSSPVVDSPSLAVNTANFYGSVRFFCPETLRIPPTVVVKNRNGASGFVTTRAPNGADLNGATVPEFVTGDINGAAVALINPSRAYFSCSVTVDAEL